MFRRALLCGVLACAATPSAAMAQIATPPAATAPDVRQVREELERLRKEFEALRRQYDDRLLALEERLRQIGGGPQMLPAGTGEGAAASAEPAVSPPTATPAAGTERVTPAVESAAPQTQPATARSNVFNPDISVIGNFVGIAGKNPMSDEPPLSFTEAELALQAVVDAYARADFYFAVSPEGAEVEEGYITFTALPADLLLKVGKLRAQFGKVNTLHTHAVPYADRPLVTENLVGGEEGLSDAGLSLSHLVQVPSVFLEVTGEVFRGSSEVYESASRSRLNYVGRVRTYRDLTESSNVDVGFSYSHGPTDGLVEPPSDVEGPVELDKQLIGLDATFRYRPLRRAIYRRLNLRTELIWSRQELPQGEQANTFGFYGLGEYQFARRWYAGARFDRSGRTFEPDATDTGGSLFITFWPTEFSQIRGQYRRINFAEGLAANEFLFQFNFSIGVHGAHVF